MLMLYILKSNIPNNRKNKNLKRQNNNVYKQKRSTLKSGNSYLVAPREFSDGQETKLTTETLVTNFGSVSSTSASVSITAIALGNDYNQRIGRQVHAKHFHLSGVLAGGQVGGVTDDAFNSFRIMIVERDIGSAPTITINTILDERITGGIMRVLYDNMFVLESPNPLTVGYQEAVERIEIDLKLNHKQAFNGTTAASISGTELALYMVSDSAAVAHPGFISGQWFTVFSDN